MNDVAENSMQTAANYVAKYSSTPYFKVYDHLQSGDINDDLAHAFDQDDEIIIAKFFISANLTGARQMLVFTNKFVRIVGKNPSIIGKMIGAVGKVPVVGWILEIAKDLLEKLFHWASRTDQKVADSLFAIPDDEILALEEKKPKKLAGRTYGLAHTYANAVKPSTGFSLRYRLFSIPAFLFRITSVRFMPREDWRNKLGSMLAAIDYILPDRAVIQPVSEFVNDAAPFLSSRGVESAVNEGRIELRWPTFTDVHPKMGSVIATNILAGLALFVGGALLLNGMEAFGGVREYEQVASLFIGGAATIGGIFALSARQAGMAFIYLFFWIAPIVLVFLETSRPIRRSYTALTIAIRYP